MSYNIIRIIPTNPYYHIAEEITYKIVNNLKARITADDIELKQYDTPVFIDCGSNLEKISCPLCGAALDFAWWRSAMDTAWKHHFTELSVKLPCCGENSTLNDLQYDFPCGFSCIELSILNPTGELDFECLSYIQTLFRTPVRCIRQHI